jgi:hypothetical protein
MASLLSSTDRKAGGSSLPDTLETGSMRLIRVCFSLSLLMAESYECAATFRWETVALRDAPSRSRDAGSNGHTGQG